MAILVKCNPGDIHTTNLIVRGSRGLPALRNGPLPQPGEHIFIWSIEEHGGVGLGGRGTVTSCRKGVRRYEIVFQQQDGAPSQPLSKASLQPYRQQNDVLGRLAEKVCSYAPPSITHLTEEQSAWLIENHYTDPPIAPLTPERSEITADRESQIEQERQRTWSLIERRAGQSRFREALIRRDGGLCAVTRCRILSVIEAAHLIPFASGDPDRDDPQNGILLRADVHILFDRGLMAIDPVSRELWLADVLVGTSYKRFRASGRRIATGAAEQYLRYHYEWACSLPNNLGSYAAAMP